MLRYGELASLKSQVCQRICRHLCDKSVARLLGLRQCKRQQFRSAVGVFAFCQVNKALHGVRLAFTGTAVNINVKPVHILLSCSKVFFLERGQDSPYYAMRYVIEITNDLAFNDKGLRPLVRVSEVLTDQGDASKRTRAFSSERVRSDACSDRKGMLEISLCGFPPLRRIRGHGDQAPAKVKSKRAFEQVGVSLSAAEELVDDTGGIARIAAFERIGRQ